MVCHHPFSIACFSCVALSTSIGVESNAADAMPRLAANRPDAPWVMTQPGLPLSRAVASIIDAATCSCRTPMYRASFRVAKLPT
jgi:hypothetical protein